MPGLPNLVGRTRETEGDRWVYGFANGLVVHTDPFVAPMPDRVLPIGGPQEMMINRLLNWPDLARGKHVLDVFCGSGILGLMALKCGAAHVDFVDINPRAAAFTRENCLRNGFEPSRWTMIEGSVADFAPSSGRYDLILANPPFVMTPPGIEGVLHSAAGPLGDDLLDLYLGRIPDVLDPDGGAYAFILQFVVDGEPLLARRLRLEGRRAQLTPVEREPTPFSVYRDAYLERFPDAHDAIGAWAAELRRAFGDALGVSHYILLIGPPDEASGACEVVNNLDAAYGEGFAYPPDVQADLARGRVVENFLPGG